MRMILAVSFIFIVGILWTAQHQVGVSSKQVANSKAIRLGIIAPLSGDWQNYGKMLEEGVVLAKEHLKNKGVNVEVYAEDGCLPAQGVASAKKLIEVDDIDALVANYCIISLVPITPLFERHKIPVFQTSVIPQDVLDASDYIFTTNSSIGAEGMALANHVFRDLGARKAAIFYLTTQWGEAFEESFAAQFRTLGGEIVAAESHAIGTDDFRASLTKLRAKNPDIIFFAHVGSMLGRAMKQARELGLKQRFVATSEAQEESVIDTAGQAAEGMQYLSPEPAVATQRTTSFGAEYKRRFKRLPSILAANAYDATILAAAAIGSCGSEHGECLRKEILRVQDYTGVSGNFSIGPSGSADREFILKRVYKSQFQRVTP